jgi:hypothetical protein
MITVPGLAAEALGSLLSSDMNRRFGSSHARWFHPQPGLRSSVSGTATPSTTPPQGLAGQKRDICAATGISCGFQATRLLREHDRPGHDGEGVGHADMADGALEPRAYGAPPRCRQCTCPGDDPGLDRRIEMLNDELRRRRSIGQLLDDDLNA